MPVTLFTVASSTPPFELVCLIYASGLQTKIAELFTSPIGNALVTPGLIKDKVVGVETDVTIQDPLILVTRSLVIPFPTFPISAVGLVTAVLDTPVAVLS